MNAKDFEIGVAGCVLENEINGQSPFLSKLIESAPESFCDLRCGKAVEAARVLRQAGKPTDVATVASQLDFEGSHLFVATCQNSALPIDAGEYYAQEQWQDFQARRSAQLLSEGMDALTASPEYAPAIRSKLISELMRLDAESVSSGLTIRTPDDILSMEFDDRDMILGDRLLAKGQPLVIAGQGGLGKSRLLLQFIVACRAGLPFIGFDTRGQEMTWLVLQGENSNRRLQQDLASLRAWVGETHWPQVNAGIHIHTLETDADNFLSLDDERTQSRIREIIASIKPDGIAWDSLYNFGAGNLSSDEDMTRTLLAIARLSKAGNSDRAIVVLHHALTGKAGASKATGFDRASFGRNSKVLHQWTRGQINVAPGQADANDVLVLSCGKCSNGKEFSPFAVRLNPETMIYELDETFDLSAWQNEVTGKRTETDLSPTRVAEIVAELCKAGGPPKKPQLVKALKDETGCATGSAYRSIERAERAKEIHYNKGSKTYVVNFAEV